TPTQASLGSVEIRVTDSNLQSTAKSLSWTVSSAPVITTNFPPDTTEESPVSQHPCAEGGVGALTWSVTAGQLPDGIGLNPSTGQISGSACASGSFTFTVRALDANDVADEKQFTIEVNPQPQITTTQLPPAVVGVAYSQGLEFTGGTGALTWSLLSGALPDGLNLDGLSGVISGTPTTAGAPSFTVRVTDEVAAY